MIQVNLYNIFITTQITHEILAIMRRMFLEHKFERPRKTAKFAPEELNYLPSFKQSSTQMHHLGTFNLISLILVHVSQFCGHSL